MAVARFRPSQGLRPQWPTRARAIGAIILGLLVLSTIVAPKSHAQGPAEAAAPSANVDADAQAKLAAERAELEAAEAKRASLAREVETLDAERAELNSKLIGMAEAIQAREVEIAAIEERMGELALQESLVRGSIAQRHVQIAKLLAAMQRMGRDPPPVMVTRRDDALDIVRSAMLLARVYPPLQRHADQLTTELSELTRLKTESEQKTAAFRAETAQLETDRVAIDGLIAEKQTLLATRSAEMGDTQKAIAALAKSVGNLEELIAKADAEIRKRRVFAAQPGEADGQPPAANLPPRAGSGNVKTAMINPGRIRARIAFAKARGQLQRPVVGRLVRNFGENDDFGSRSEGMVWETADRAQVSAPAEGWVVYAGQFRSYGELLILNVGDGYHIVIAGMARLNVTPGQFVLSGEPVGAMPVATVPTERPVAIKTGLGEDLSGSKPRLYVVFKRNGQAIDPAPWWADAPIKAQG